jgi:arylsulfatase A-like enzyme
VPSAAARIDTTGRCAEDILSEAARSLARRLVLPLMPVGSGIAGRSACAAALALLFGAACGREEQQPARPNVLLLVIDTLRADALADPDELVRTPRLDALARDSVVFRSAWSHAPMTLPAHTALLSSRPPFETGVLNNGQTVPDELPLLGPHLAGFGYRTDGIISLGTLIGPRPSGGIAHGFERFRHAPGPVGTGEAVYSTVEPLLDELAGDRPFFLFTHFSDPHEPYNVHGAMRKEAEILVDGEVVEVVQTADMTYWLRGLLHAPGEHELVLRSRAPFCVRIMNCKRGRTRAEVQLVDCSLSRPTRLFTARIDNDSSFERRFDFEIWVNDSPNPKNIPARYVREVEYVDEWIGRLVDALVTRGLYDDTVIVFTSDHGEGLGEHGHFGHVENLHQELLHVPLFLKLPRTLSGSRSALDARKDDFVRHVDVVPTILELLGLPRLPGQRGAPLMEELDERVLVAQTHRPEAKRDLIALRDASRVLVYDAGADRFELYDVGADPGELQDRFEERGRELAEWQATLRSLAELGEQHALKREEMDPELLDQMRALGYFGDG